MLLDVLALTFYVPLLRLTLPDDGSRKFIHWVISPKNEFSRGRDDAIGANVNSQISSRVTNQVKPVLSAINNFVFMSL